MGRLTGKVALVTGASRGIGANIAETLAADGASVVVNYASSADKAAAVVEAITSAGGSATAVAGRVSSRAEVAALVAAATRAYGPIDILVNNAGVYGAQPIEVVTEDAFHHHFDTNVLGVLLVTQAVVAQFGPEGGSIVNTSSIISRTTPPNFVVYNATKAAVDAITRTLAKELGPRHVRVNAINPGVVATDGARAAGLTGTETERHIVAQTPLGRIAKPDDIGPIAAFLASDDARWITGEVIYAAGGM